MARQVLGSNWGERKRSSWGQWDHNHSVMVCFLWMVFQQKGCTKDSYMGCNSKLVFICSIFISFVLFPTLHSKIFLRNQGDKDLLPEVCLGRDAISEPDPHRSCGVPLLSSFAALFFLSPYKEHEGATFPLSFYCRHEEE